MIVALSWRASAPPAGVFHLSALTRARVIFCDAIQTSSACISTAQSPDIRRGDDDDLVERADEGDAPLQPAHDEQREPHRLDRVANLIKMTWRDDLRGVHEGDVLLQEVTFVYVVTVVTGRRTVLTTAACLSRASILTTSSGGGLASSAATAPTTSGSIASRLGI